MPDALCGGRSGALSTPGSYPGLPPHTQVKNFDFWWKFLEAQKSPDQFNSAMRLKLGSRLSYVDWMNVRNNVYLLFSMSFLIFESIMAGREWDHIGRRKIDRIEKDRKKSENGTSTEKKKSKVTKEKRKKCR